MKISKQQLRQIIKEEVQNTLKELGQDERPSGTGPSYPEQDNKAFKAPTPGERGAIGPGDKQWDPSYPKNGTDRYNPAEHKCSGGLAAGKKVYFTVENYQLYPYPGADGYDYEVGPRGSYKYVWKGFECDRLEIALQREKQDAEWDEKARPSSEDEEPYRGVGQKLGSFFKGKGFKESLEQIIKEEVHRLRARGR